MVLHIRRCCWAERARGGAGVERAIGRGGSCAPLRRRHGQDCIARDCIGLHGIGWDHDAWDALPMGWDGAGWDGVGCDACATCAMRCKGCGPDSRAPVAGRHAPELHADHTHVSMMVRTQRQ
eukprot:450520-Rhodomonas_salina.1